MSIECYNIMNDDKKLMMFNTFFFWQQVNILVRSGTWLCSGLKWTWVLVLGEARWPDIHCTMISISFIKFCPTLCPPWVIETICQYISWPFNGDFASVVSSNKVPRVGFLFIDHRGPSPPIYVIGICCLFFYEPFL